jgi:O-antigen/teichoic acid export membrane protein
MPTFWRQVLTVLTGALAAQALPILAAPLVTRLCTPAELGAFSVWFGLVAVAAIAATLRLENAMILDHGEQEQRTCFSVVAGSASWLALLLTLAAVAGRLTGRAPFAQMSWPELLSLGAGAWLTAYMQTTLAYATSHRAFGQAAKAKVWAAATIALAQLALLAAGARAHGLLIGQLLGLATGLVAACLLLRPPLPRLRLLPDAQQRRYLHKHQAFWRYTLVANLLNAGVGQFPLLLVGARYGAPAAGLLALTQRLLAAPISLLAASVQEVFKRQSVHEFETLGHCTHAYRHTFRILLLLGTPPSLLLLFTAPDLFALAFGAPWRAAGELAQLLVPLYFLSFVASPLSYVFFVAGKQKPELAWQVVLFAMTMAVFTLPATLHDCVLAYAIGYSLLYLVYLQMSYRYARNLQGPQRLAAALERQS